MSLTRGLSAKIAARHVTLLIAHCAVSVWQEIGKTDAPKAYGQKGTNM